MAEEYVDVALIEIERNGTITTLEDVVDIKVDTTINKELVKTMNRRRLGRGFKRGVKEVTGTLTVVKRVNPEFPWRDVLSNDETLQLYFEENEGGKRYQLVDFTLGDIGNSVDEGGEATLDISFMAIDEVEVP